MKQFRSDRYIRQQLAQHSTPVDVQALWANIEGEVRPEKRSRKLLILWIFLGLAAGITAWMLFPTPTSEPANSGLPEAPVIATQHATQPTPNHAPVDNNNTVVQEVTSSSAPTSPTVVPTNTNLSTTVSPQKANRFASQTNIDRELPPPSDPTSVSQPNLASTTPKATAPSTPTESSAEPSNQIPRLGMAAPISSLDYTPLDVPTRPLPAAQSTSIFKGKSSNGYSPWSAYFKVGIGSNNRDLSTSNDSFDLYQSRRERSEEKLEHFSAEVGLQWTSAQNWYFRTGLGYRQATDRFSFSDTREEIITDPEGIIRIVLGPNGDTTEIVRGPVTGTRTITQEKETYNRYRFLEIPLILGYTFGEGPFSFGLETGVVPQFLFQTTGEVLGFTEGSTLEVSDISNTKLTWSLHTAFNINYDLTGEWQVQLSPTFRYQFSNLHESNYPLDVSYHSLGIQAGLRYSW